MTNHHGNPFGGQPGPSGPFGPGPSQPSGPFGPGPGAGPGYGPGPGQFQSGQHPGFPGKHPNPTPPRSGQSTAKTVGLVVGAFALVAALGIGGAFAYDAVTDDPEGQPNPSGVVNPDPERDQSDESEQSGSDSLILDEDDSGQADDLAPSEDGEVQDNADRSEIYRNSTDFRFLEDQVGGLVPGASFYTESGGACSVGWFVAKEGADVAYMTTAGHCVEKGEEIFYVDANGDPVVAGKAVLSTGGNLESDLDYGLIELYPEAEWQATIPVHESLQVVGSANATWVEENKPYICRLGYRSGLSCGSFIERETDNVFRYENISDQGDSGGPVWAQDPATGEWYAVGITSFMEYADATNAGAMALAPLLKANDFKIVAG